MPPLRIVSDPWHMANWAEQRDESPAALRSAQINPGRYHDNVADQPSPVVARHTVCLWRSLTAATTLHRLPGKAARRRRAGVGEGA
jgi:hypothetical protein